MCLGNDYGTNGRNNGVLQNEPKSRWFVFITVVQNQHALLGEDIISQITATLSPEHRRATKKKFMEIFNNWEGYNTYTQTQVFTPEFTEECRKLCPDLTKPTTNNDLSVRIRSQFNKQTLI